jgi:hypothetical protein
MTKVAETFGLVFCLQKLCINFRKNGLGYILADFFQTHLGPMLWFKNIFSEKSCITLVFEKNANFFAENWQKSQKIVIITSTPRSPWPSCTYLCMHACTYLSDETVGDAVMVINDKTFHVFRPVKYFAIFLTNLLSDRKNSFRCKYLHFYSILIIFNYRNLPF